MSMDESNIIRTQSNINMGASQKWQKPTLESTHQMEVFLLVVEGRDELNISSVFDDTIRTPVSLMVSGNRWIKRGGGVRVDYESG